MSHPRVLNSFVLRNISVIVDEKIVLDIGCGLGLWGHIILKKKIKDNGCLIGIDIYKPYLKISQKRHVYNDLVLCDASELPFKDNNFNLVLAGGIIEHFPKYKGIKLLTEIERVCDGRSIVTTPNGYWPQISSIEAQIHMSGWDVKDFKSRGYKVRGLGLKLVKSCERHPYLWLFFTLFLTPISYVFPNMAGLLIAVKDMKEQVKKSKKNKK